jgi:hypothetical protein
MDIWNLRGALKELEIEPIEDRLFSLINDINKSPISDPNSLEYPQFLRAIQLHQPWKEDLIINKDDETRKLADLSSYNY